MYIRDVAADVMASKQITAGDVTELRRAIYQDGAAETGEVERLFAIDEAAEKRDPSWAELFAEAVTDYLVEQVQPYGYIDEGNADWLIDRIGRDGTVKTETELEALIKVLERAKSSPERLVAYALNQVRKAVVDGKGPVARGAALTPGRIGRAEVELIRRIIYAFGGDGHVAITRSEADILFDINDATVAADNDPAWSDLFVKAVANFLMAASGYKVPTRQEAIRREAWLDTPSAGVGDFFSRMAAGGLRGILTPTGSRVVRKHGPSAMQGPRRRSPAPRWSPPRRRSGSRGGSARMACCTIMRRPCFASFATRRRQFIPR